MECKTQKNALDWPNLYISDTGTNRQAVKHCPPAWSRLHNRNTAGIFRNIPLSKLNEYDVEICDQLWSLWGSLHPEATIFDANVRGKQYLACYVVACCANKLYPLLHWNSQLLDAIVVNGDRYHCESLSSPREPDGEFALEHLNTTCRLDNRHFRVRLTHLVCGQLYNRPSRYSMNVTTALLYFFRRFKFGILQCGKRSLAVGRKRGKSGGYFMYDCQSRGNPLFPPSQGASYLLRTTQLQMLLYCISVTLSTLNSAAVFNLHRVEVRRVSPDLGQSDTK